MVYGCNDSTSWSKVQLTIKGPGFAFFRLIPTPTSARVLCLCPCKNVKFADIAYRENTPWHRQHSCLIYTTMKDNELLQAVVSASAPLRRPTHRSPPRILVVDEDSDLRLLYTEALVRPGYHVDAAEDGAAALKALRVNNYNLLITEHNLPTLTGVELVKTLRAARMALPVIMAAARLPIHELTRSPSLQPVAVLPKPFYISQLLETVKAALRATDNRRELIVPLPGWQSQPSANGLRL